MLKKLDAFYQNCKKCIGFIFFASIIFLPEPTFAQDLKVSGNYFEADLRDVLEDIEKHHSIRFFYRKKWLFTEKINGNFSQQPLTEVLDELLQNSDLTYITYGSDIIIIAKKERIGKLESKEYYLAKKSEETVIFDRKFPLLTVGDSLNISNSENTVSFELTDKNEGFPLEGVAIYFELLESTFNSDNNGKVTLILPYGVHQMEVRRIGYEPYFRNLQVFSDGVVGIEMESEVVELEEVVISGEGPDRRLMNAQTGIVTITPKQIKEMPVFLGEADVIQTIQTVPGVTTLGEGAPGFFVRGGNVDQNLILQDEVIFSNSSHALGFFSLFNPDLISNVQLYKGSIPAQYGGRLSSILDVQLKENNYTTSTINGGIGTVISKLAIETPLIKEKLSVLAGGRISYADWILPIIKVPEIRESKAFFYDLNLKLSARISENGSINVGYFQSFDEVNFQNEAGFEWANKSLSFDWNQGIGQKVQSELKATWGQTDNLNFDPSGVVLTELSNGLEFIKLKEIITVPLDKHMLVGGVEWVSYRPQDEVLTTLGTGDQVDRLPKDYGQEFGFFVNDQWDLNDRLAFSVGLRTSLFLGEERGPEEDENPEYLNLEPRISGRFRLGSSSSLKASYNKMSQYVHLLSNTTGVLPIDQWVVSNSTIRPSTSNNFSLGYFRNFKSNTWESSAEVFYRRMSNIIEFKDFADLVLNPNLEEEVIQGDGKAYGLELFLRRNTGKVKGNLSYTYSRTFIEASLSQDSDDLKWFPTRFDRPHSVNLVMDWTLNRKSKFALVFNFTSGRPITAPVSSYRLGDIVVPNYSDRNEYRIPNYHRLDLSYTYRRNAVKRKRYQDSITFAIYNIYSRRNAFSVFFRKENNSPPKAYRLSVLGSAFPSITYTFEFK